MWEILGCRSAEEVGIATWAGKRWYRIPKNIRGAGGGEEEGRKKKKEKKAEMFK